MNVGDRVQLLYCPDLRGTITAIYRNGDFRVSYDSHGRERKEARARVIFPKSKADLFLPEGAIESTDFLPFSSILDQLLKEHGIAT